MTHQRWRGATVRLPKPSKRPTSRYPPAPTCAAAAYRRSPRGGSRTCHGFCRTDRSLGCSAAPNLGLGSGTLGLFGSLFRASRNSADGVKIVHVWPTHAVTLMTSLLGEFLPRSSKTACRFSTSRPMRSTAVSRARWSRMTANRCAGDAESSVR